MRRRSSSRILVLNSIGSLLLFRFLHKTGALEGQDYWATPGGELEPGGSFAVAAIRELKEEAGMVAIDVGDAIAWRDFVLRLPDGEEVIADEQFFVLKVTDQTVLADSRSPQEAEVMSDHKWWTAQELRLTSDMVWPVDLPEMLTRSGWWQQS